MDLVNPFGLPVQEEPPKPTPFDYATRFIIPLLSLAAVIVSALQQHPVAMGVLIGITFFSLILGFLPQGRAWASRYAHARHDERAVRRAFPALRKFVDRFGEFVSTSSGLTLHAIAQSEAHSPGPGPLMKLGMASIDIFQGFWSTLNERAKTEDPTLANFRLSLSEFAMLIGLYNNHCMHAVFERLPQELRAQATGLPKQVEAQIDWERMRQRPPGQLSENAKRSLGAFRECFNAFLNDYERFLQGFDDGFARRHLAIGSFPRFKPL